MDLVERMLTSGNPSEPIYFEFLKFDTFDPFFNTIITKVFDFVLVTRRHFLKCFHKTQLHQFIDLIIIELSNLDKTAYRLYC